MDIGHGESRLGATIGFGFLQSASPGAATLRGGRHAAGHSRLRHNAPTGRDAQSTDDGFSHPTIYRGRQPATMASSRLATAPAEGHWGANVAVPPLVLRVQGEGLTTSYTRNAWNGRAVGA